MAAADRATTAQQRYERNKYINTVLARHAVDLTRLSCSCSTHSIVLSGYLSKQPTGDFTPQGVEALLKELDANPFRMSIQCTLGNWDVSCVRGSWQVQQKKAASRGSTGGEQVLEIHEGLAGAVRNLFKD